MELLRQRIFQISAGYEDANDSDSLRKDSVMKMICNEESSNEKELGSQPTITRLENRITNSDIKNLRKFFVDKYILSFKKVPEEIILDIDSYADETHGNQQLTFFNGFHNHYMYHPVMINDAKTGYPVLLELRAGNCHAGKGIKSLLRWLIWRLKQAFPNVRIIMRGDSGFSLPEIVSVCERSGIEYVFGYAKNAVLERKIAFLSEQARLEFLKTDCSSKLFDDVYYMAGSWNKFRRVIMKAEHNSKGTNQRFLLEQNLRNHEFLP